MRLVSPLLTLLVLAFPENVGAQSSEKVPPSKQSVKASGSLEAGPPKKVLVTSVDSGGLEGKAARASVEKQLVNLEKCRQRHLESKTGIRGDVNFRVLVNEKGQVVAATVESSTLNHEKLMQCARRNAMDLRFAASQKHVTVRYGLRFSGRSLIEALRSGDSGKASLSDVVTNFDAVDSKASSKGLFKITGVLKGANGKVSFARRGGAGGVKTIGANQLKSSNPPAKGRTVRGRVSSVSAQARVKGSLDRDEVIGVVRRRMSAITRCYERRLVSNPTLSGKLVFGWTIVASGRVGSVSVRSSTLGDPQVASCISGVIRGTKFPQPKRGSVQVSYPFFFRAGR